MTDRARAPAGRTDSAAASLLQQMRQRKTEHAQSADAQEIAPPEPIAAPIDPSIQSNVQHVAPSMIENKLLRVQQCPKQIVKHLIPRAAFERRLHGRPFRVGRLAAKRA